MSDRNAFVNRRAKSERGASKRHGFGASFFALSVAALGFACASDSVAQRPDAATERPASRAVFERRILPILQAKDPSSCAECHLSGVDLKDYIRPSEAQTFVSLRDQGLIDVKRPADSRLLRLIQMSAPRSPLLNQKARQTEYEAFRDWIEAAAKNPALASAPAPPASKRAGPAVPNAVIRHARLDRVAASFARNIWSQEGRCMGCHRPGTPENDANVKKFGERVRWFVPDDPEATMRKIIAQGLVNVDAPDQSLLLLKPLNKVPHGGGVKMLYGDASYQMFRAWVEDYAASVKGRYRAEKDLPAPPKTGLAYTNCILTVSETPAAWVDKNLRVDVYAWDRARSDWTEKPAATGERQVGDNRSTNLLMFRIVPAGGAEEKAAWREARLEPGRYLFKYYVDISGKSARDYRTPTDSPAFYQGRQEIASEWKRGWGDATKIRIAVRN